MVKQLLDRVAAYPPFWNFARRIIEANHGAEKAAIRRELGDVQGPVLDVPCGTGIFSPLFLNAYYTGIDASDVYVSYARRKYRDKRFEVMDALAMDLADDSFAAVLVVGFLHHLDESDVRRTLAEVRRVLRPGGRFLLIEDCPTRSRWNFGGRVLQSMDAGGRIRPAQWYANALREHFEIDLEYPLRAGLWDYSAFVLH